ncbi:MAG: CehA/McbA family metallohydrolase [Candidatus Promineifilaceae bacterium]|nr:CehA/McbA family metallohydrolase [Candidatus Promineifilaceae bacterium]
MVELVGNMHIHTPYSDGVKWHREVAHDAARAGLDFIIVTDHNVWVGGVEGYYEFDEGRVLLLAGEEVHDVRRQPQANHFLVYGAEQEMSQHAPQPQTLIHATTDAGGYGFLAHPFELDLDLFDGPNLGWHDWEVTGYTGLEIWNYMSSFKNEVARRLACLRVHHPLYAKIQVARMAFHPERHVTGPEEEVLAKWDELLAAGNRVAAVGNSDAHGTPMRLGPIRRTIFPYEFLFRTVNTHIVLDDELSGELAHDKKLVLQAIGRGRGWVGYDMAHPTNGFRFSGKGVTKGIMGDEVELDTGATLQVLAPTKANIRLIHRGELVAEVRNEENLTYTPTEKGAYRVECTRLFEGRERGWIYSNPIYLV